MTATSTPSFIIRNLDDSLKQWLLENGFTTQESLPNDVLVSGTNLLQVPANITKSPLIKILDARKNTAEIMEIAALQKRWNVNAEKKELLIGTPANGKVIVTKVAVMIDRCLLPIDVFRKVKRELNAIKTPLIASHKPVINPALPFMTVGCADYSMNDFDAIISAYDELITPGA